MDIYLAAVGVSSEGISAECWRSLWLAIYLCKALTARKGTLADSSNVILQGNHLKAFTLEEGIDSKGG